MIHDIICSEQIIQFKCNNYDIILYAIGDCCSESWFEYNEDSIKECIGKFYLKCIDTYSTIELEHSGRQDYDINHIYHIHFHDDSSYEIILRNSSNGYYDGYIKEEITELNTLPINTKKNGLIILIGLPGCGKTTYGNMIKDSIKNSIFYDDIEMLSSVIDNIKRDLLLQKTVIVASPRFCSNTLYYDFIERLDLSNNDDSIITYCFIPDKEQSIININRREQSKNIRNKLITTINNYSTYYTKEYIETAYQYKCKKIQTYK